MYISLIQQHQSGHGGIANHADGVDAYNLGAHEGGYEEGHGNPEAPGLAGGVEVVGRH